MKKNNCEIKVKMTISFEWKGKYGTCIWEKNLY